MRISDAIRGCFLRLLSLKLILCLFCVLAVAGAALPAWYWTYETGVATVNNLLHNFQLEVIPLIASNIGNRLAKYEMCWESYV